MGGVLVSDLMKQAFLLDLPGVQLKQGSMNGV
jgi:hypothetical protein